jgi:adenylate cyclase
MHALWTLGYADQAAECGRRAFAVARDQGHTFSVGFMLSVGELTVRQYRREPEAMRTALRRLDALGADAELGMFQLWACVFQGWLASIEDHDSTGPTRIGQAINQWEADSVQGGRAYQYVLLAEAYLVLGQADSALAVLEQILDQINTTGFRFFEAEVIRLVGEAWRMLDRLDEAEAYFLRAIAAAQAQAAKSWELRSVMSLRQLRQARGAPAQFKQARRQLAELCAWFNEGLDTPDLQAAAGLVAETRLFAGDDL